MNIWRKVRFFLFFLSLIEGLIYPFIMKDNPFVDIPILYQLLMVVLTVLFLPIGLVLLISVQSINPMQHKQWTLPDWDSNFLDFQNPLAFFHAAAYFICAIGIGAMFASLFTNLSAIIMGLWWTLGGISILLGVKLCTKVFKKKFTVQTISSEIHEKKRHLLVITSKVIGAILIVATIIEGIIGGYFLIDSLDFKKNAIRTEGVVVELKIKNNKTGKTYYPVFKFIDVNGQTHAICSNIGSNPSQYKVKDKISIFYNPVDPQQAEISSFLSLYSVPLVTGISGMINFLTGFLFLFGVPFFLRKTGKTK